MGGDPKWASAVLGWVWMIAIPIILTVIFLLVLNFGIALVLAEGDLVEAGRIFGLWLMCFGLVVLTTGVFLGLTYWIWAWA